MTDTARYLRQVLLPEIGEAGQRLLATATAKVGAPGGDAEAGAGALRHEVASLYALGAGFAAVTQGAIDRDALAPAELVEREAAREVLAGARAALRAMRAALGTPPDGLARAAGGRAP